MDEMHIKNLLDGFGISSKSYNLVVDGYGGYIIYINLNRRYMIQLDHDNKGYNLLGENLVANHKKKCRYHLIKKFSTMDDAVKAIC